MAEEKAKRPFWVHQVAEYVIGLGLVAAGIQNPEPLWPVLAGGLIVLNAAVVSGPLGAWRAVTRPQHRWTDVAVMAAVAIVAVLPFLDVDNASRLMMLGCVAVLAVVWTQSDYRESVLSQRRGVPVNRSEAIGRTAGRLFAHSRALARQQKGRHIARQRRGS